MRIGFVISNIGGGGAERVCSVLCNEWVAREHEVAIFLTSPEASKPYIFDSRISIVPIQGNGNLVKPLAKIKALLKAVQIYKPDVLVSFLDMPSFYAIKCGQKLKIPVVCSERNDPRVYPKEKLVRLIRRYNFRYAKKIVFQTPGALEYFRKYSSKSAIIPNPVSINISRENSNSNVVSAGRLNHQKGFDILINAFEIVHHKYPELTLTIYGNGEEEASLMDLIQSKSLENTISIMPFSTNLHSEIARSLLFVSSSRCEGIPNVLLEALSIGTPCVATDCSPGGSKFLLKDNAYSILSKNESVLDLGNNIIKMYENYFYYYEGSLKMADTYKEKFSPRKISEIWLKLLESVV